MPPHSSTNRALRRLTSEVGRDPVHSTRYGRQRWRMLGTIGHAGGQLTVRTKAKHCTNPARDLLSLNSKFSKSPCKHYASAQNQYPETRQTTLARNCARHEIRAVNRQPWSGAHRHRAPPNATHTRAPRYRGTPWWQSTQRLTYHCKRQPWCGEAVNRQPWR